MIYCCVWYRADDSAFTQNVEMIETKPIAAEEEHHYTLTEADNGKYIRFGVTPRSDAEEENLGDETFAQLAERGADTADNTCCFDFEPQRWV